MTTLSLQERASLFLLAVTSEAYYLLQSQMDFAAYSATFTEQERMLGDPSLAVKLRTRFKLPVIAGPMFLVSGPELVIACCQAGVAGSFPTLNARTTAILDQWLARITAEVKPGTAPYAANLIVHQTNTRLAEDVDLVVKY